MILYGILGIVGIVLLFSSIIVTPQKHYKFVMFMGKYWFTAKEGLSFKIPFVSWVDNQVYTGVCEEEVPLTLKTKDQATFGLTLKVLYKISDNVSEAFKAVYDLEDYEDQIITMATDAAIPAANKIEMEDVYDKKELVADAAADALREFFSEYGIEIKRVLSDEPKLPEEVEAQANRVLAEKRRNEAAKYKAEAIKTEKVGEAEADGESVRIRMEKLGLARSDYAKASAEAVQELVAAGCDANAALNFLTKVGDNDALVTSARSGNTIIYAQSADVGGGSNIPATVGALEAVNRQKARKSQETESE